MVKKINEVTLQAYYNVFNSPEGQIVLEDLEQFTECDSQSYEPGLSFDTVAYNEGLRAVMLYIRQGMQGLAQLEQEEQDVGRESEPELG